MTQPGWADVRGTAVGLAVELRQRIEECARRRVGRKRRGDIVGEIAALRTFRASSTVTSSPIAIPVLSRRFGARMSTHPLPAGTSLVRIRQVPIVPLTGWSALAPHASSGSNGIVMSFAIGSKPRAGR
jgi:hypothetical protein